MTISARIILDSLAPCGKRLTTFELTYPRFVHSELLTHRNFSRNASSSRAIPIAKMVERARTNPAMPIFWGKNQKGMQAREELPEDARARAAEIWLCARDLAVQAALDMAELGASKETANRLLEPFSHITTLVSSTEWGNFLHQRNHRDAQRELARVAELVHDLLRDEVPQRLLAGEWHLPFIAEEDVEHAFDEAHSNNWGSSREAIQAYLRKISTGRCARVSYLNHDGVRAPGDDALLHDRLIAGRDTGDPLHMSPFEHPAMACPTKVRSGNFVGFCQYRKMIAGEAGGDDV